MSQFPSCAHVAAVHQPSRRATAIHSRFQGRTRILSYCTHLDIPRSLSSFVRCSLLHAHTSCSSVKKLLNTCASLNVLYEVHAGRWTKRRRVPLAICENYRIHTKHV
jgi:hypothetical protein